MSSSVSGSTAPVGLSTLSEVLRLTTKRPLVDLAVLRSRLVSMSAQESHTYCPVTYERTTVVFQLNDRRRRLTGHVVNSVLVTEPVRTFHSVVHVPPPVVLVHVSERSIDTTLSSNGVRTSREELGNTSSVETSLGQTESRAQTCTSGSDNDGIVLMVLL